MSNPDGLWTLEELYAATQTTLPLPKLSALLGRQASVTVRRISIDEHRACLPGLPPESETWTEAQFQERLVAWLRALPEDAAEERRMARARTAYRIVALAALEPTMTLQAAERLGDEALEVAVEILRFSELLKPAADGA